MFGAQRTKQTPNEIVTVEGEDNRKSETAHELCILTKGHCGMIEEFKIKVEKSVFQLKITGAVTWRMN